ncbi:hypothetical protein AVEN_226704-1 [Araneus ventricosus]|uniref:Uncharacterized protein n=1 Tax=Araneus ventricosus TaxID=182803 RepID=A0A4Y2CZB9_ARAVE|nr:hypothetical protein AVEN_226704-1 [Araneus ventricosus]
MVSFMTSSHLNSRLHHQDEGRCENRLETEGPYLGCTVMLYKSHPACRVSDGHRTNMYKRYLDEKKTTFPFWNCFFRFFANGITNFD